jgi:hypothetical protein
MDQRFDAFGQRLDAMSRTIDERFAMQDERFTGMDVQLARLEANVARLFLERQPNFDEAAKEFRHLRWGLGTVIALVLGLVTKVILDWAMP